MTKVWFLVAMFGGDWSMTPYTTLALCNDAIGGLSIVLVTEAKCTPAEIIKPSNIYAPEMAPMPPRKPGDNV